MNYFEFYDLPESFIPDEQDVKRKFYAFSKQYHPDFYIGEPDEKQQQILELSTLNNKAYDVLSHPRKLTEYILSQHGLLDEAYKLPGDFLMQMMDLNESVTDLGPEPDADKLLALQEEATDIAADLDKELLALYEDFDREAEGREKVLLAIRDRWYRRKYLLRLQDTFDKFAPR